MSNFKGVVEHGKRRFRSTQTFLPAFPRSEDDDHFHNVNIFRLSSLQKR